ncbi:MAG: hypothetical protein ACRC42_02050, partial [Mycoplasma sp.]
MKISKQSNTKEKSTVDALLNDYTENKNVYEELVNQKTSFSYQYWERIYLKYSQSLEEYMKKNLKGWKWTGNKFYTNIPIDIYLKESAKYKEEIKNKIHNKDKKITNSCALDSIFLTPWPDYPRILLDTEKEKSDFLLAERTAVSMRKFEYTSAMRYKGMW